MRQELLLLFGFPTFLVTFVAVTNLLMGRSASVSDYAMGFGVGFGITLLTILLMGLPRMGRARAHRPLFEPLQRKLSFAKTPGSIMSAPGLTGTIDGVTVTISDILEGRSPGLEVVVSGPVGRPVYFKRREEPSLFGYLPPKHPPVSVGGWSLWGITRGAGSSRLHAALAAQEGRPLQGATADGTLRIRTTMYLGGTTAASLEAVARELVALHAATTRAARAPADPLQQAAARQIHADARRFQERTDR